MPKIFHVGLFIFNALCLLPIRFTFMDVLLPLFLTQSLSLTPTISLHRPLSLPFSPCFTLTHTSRRFSSRLNALLFSFARRRFSVSLSPLQHLVYKLISILHYLCSSSKFFAPTTLSLTRSFTRWQFEILYRIGKSSIHSIVVSFGCY